MRLMWKAAGRGVGLVRWSSVAARRRRGKRLMEEEVEMQSWSGMWQPIRAPRPLEWQRLVVACDTSKQKREEVSDRIVQAGPLDRSAPRESELIRARPPSGWLFVLLGRFLLDADLQQGNVISIVFIVCSQGLFWLADDVRLVLLVVGGRQHLSVRVGRHRFRFVGGICTEKTTNEGVGSANSSCCKTQVVVWLFGAASA